MLIGRNKTSFKFRLVKLLHIRYYLQDYKVSRKDILSIITKNLIIRKKNFIERSQRRIFRKLGINIELPFLINSFLLHEVNL